MENDVRFELTFLGAAQVVTGSSYLMHVFDGGTRLTTIMVDHGMFQGVDDEYLNYREYEFDPATIDYLLLTHAHVDHCGLIPRLYKNGFRGRVLCTQQTFELCELILFDSAKIQSNRLQREGIEPLYDANDVIGVLSQFEVVNVGEKYELEVNIGSIAQPQGYPDAAGNQLEVLPVRAGHILGAVSYHIKYKNRSICFSGDLGRRSQLVVKPYEPIELKSDYVVMESLYGGKKHENFEVVRQGFIDTINKTLARNGNVIIPAFSVQRSQEVLLMLNQFIKEGKLASNVQIYFDSPLAINVTEVYTSNNFELASELANEGNFTRAIYTRNVHVVKNSKKYKKIAQGKKQIIVTGGGMCNGGRIVGYLKTVLRNANDTVTLIGFQAEGTLGRELAEGKKKVEIDGQVYEVRAGIEMFRGFSAHGDHDDLVSWLSNIDKAGLSNVYLVHAEIEQSSSFKTSLESKGYKVEIPKIGDKVSL